MPAQGWKATVKELDAALDKYRQHVDKLVTSDEDEADGIKNMERKQVYRNPNTKVEVVVKTRKTPKKKDNMEWGSILSEAAASTAHGVDPRPKAKVPPRFAAGTKSSKAKGLLSTATTKSKTSKASRASHAIDMVDKGRNKRTAGSEVQTGTGSAEAISQHKFPNRTLQVFLREMRLALKCEDVDLGNKILDDLEFVAANLDDSGVANSFYPQASAHIPAQNKSHIYDISLMKAEVKTANAANGDLKREIYKLNKHARILEDEVDIKDKKIADLKTIVAKLTTNNNEMLNILTSKANVDDKVKSLEKANQKLRQDWSLEAKKNSQLETQLKAADTEINRLHKIVEDLKGSLNKNLERVQQRIAAKDSPTADFELETGPVQNADFSSTDLGLSMSTDADKTLDDIRAVDDDKDSALGEGISESQPISTSSAAIVHASLPPNTGSKSADRDQISKPVSQEQLPQLSFKQGQLDETEASFKVLELSETAASSSVLSASGAEESAGKPEVPPAAVAQLPVHQTQEEVVPAKPTVDKKAMVEAVVGNFDGKMEDFLKRMRTDKRVHVTLGSDVARVPGALDTTDSNFGFSTDFDSSTLTERRFRKGLEATLETFNDTD